MPGGEFLAMEGPSFADGERFIVLLHKVLHTCEGTVPWAVKFAEVASKMVLRCTKAGQGNLGKHDICGTYPRTVRSDSYLSGRQSKEKQTRWAHCKATARPDPPILQNRSVYVRAAGGGWFRKVSHIYYCT